MESHATADVMPRHPLHADGGERSRHFGEIQVLADELGRPVPEIAQLYEDVLDSLRAQARVTDFLAVLVSKRVRALCRRRHGAAGQA